LDPDSTKSLATDPDSLIQIKADLQNCHDFHRAINDRAEEIKNVTKGKEDDKVYRGLNYYNQYIEKKESLIGTVPGYYPLFLSGHCTLLLNTVDKGRQKGLTRLCSKVQRF
jgi:hypothetical protein